MSRAQGIRTLFLGEQIASQTETLPIAGKGLPGIGTHRSRCEQSRPDLLQTGGELSRIALSAIGHQP